MQLQIDDGTEAIPTSFEQNSNISIRIQLIHSAYGGLSKSKLGRGKRHLNVLS
jgi:hypothetical protein